MGAVLHGKICKSCHVSSSFSHGHSHGGGHGHSHSGDVGGGHGHSHSSGAQSYSRSRSRFANRQHINASGSTDDDDCLLVPENDDVATDPFGQYVTGSPDSIDDVLICNADDRNCNVPLQQDSSVRHGAVPQPPTEQTNINVRAAMIHVIGDFIQSIGVLAAALIIHFAGVSVSSVVTTVLLLLLLPDVCMLTFID
jgi:Co/Zn/Cd efflux system component